MTPSSCASILDCEPRLEETRLRAAFTGRIDLRQGATGDMDV